MYVDYMIWPWLERLEVLKRINNFQFDSNELPRLIAYITRMNEQPAVKHVSIPTEVCENFFRSLSKGKEPNYDSGLKLGL